MHAPQMKNIIVFTTSNQTWHKISHPLWGGVKHSVPQCKLHCVNWASNCNHDLDAVVNALYKSETGELVITMPLLSAQCSVSVTQ